MFKYCVAGFAKKAMGMSKTQPLKSSVVLSKSSSVVSSSSSESSSCPSQKWPDASRGRSSSSCRAGNSKEELEGTAELPQGGLGGPEPWWGVEEVEGEALRRQADYGEGPLRQAVDAEQVDLQLKSWGETSSSQNQAPEYLSGVLQRRFPLKTTNDSIPLLQVDRFVNVAQKSWCWYFSGLDIITLCVFPKSSHLYVQNIFSTFHYNQKQKKPPRLAISWLPTPIVSWTQLTSF